MSEWDFQWEEVHASERKTSPVSAEEVCPSSSQVNCLLVLLGPKRHKELGNTDDNNSQCAGRGCDANKSSYSQVICPDGLRTTGIYSYLKVSFNNKSMQRKQVIKNCFWQEAPMDFTCDCLFQHKWWSPGRALKHPFKASMEAAFLVYLQTECVQLGTHPALNLSISLKEQPSQVQLEWCHG